MRAFGALARAMVLGFLRDKMTVFFAVVFPLMFLILFGGLLTDSGTSEAEVLQVGDVPVLDELPAEAAEALGDALEITRVDDLDAALDQVRTGDVDAVVRAEGSTVVLAFSQADQVRSGIILGTFEGIVQSANLAVTGADPTFTFAPESVEDDSFETIQFVTPGLLGWAVAMSATFGAAMNLVLWRKNGLLRRLRLAPIPTSSVVLARVVVAMGVALVQGAIFLGLAVGAFGLDLAGTWYLIIPLLLVGTLAFLAIGFLVGSISKTEEGGVGMANFIILPMAFLSGSFFPLDGAPGWLQAVGQALPLYHLNQGMMDTMVRGEGFTALIAPIGILLGFTLVLTIIAAKLFRWDK